VQCCGAWGVCSEGVQEDALVKEQQGHGISSVLIYHLGVALR